MLSRLRALLDPRSESMRRLRRLRRPAVDGLLGVRPLTDRWGWERGTPVDRYYIEQFLAANASDVRGRVLEVKDAGYTRQFGRSVERSDVLDIDSANPEATLVADLARGDGIPAESFDCFVLTQTLQFIYDVHATVVQTHRLLRPGGVALVTLPVVSRLSPGDGLDGDYWRFTPAGCARLFGDVFGAERVTVRTYGNVLSCIAFLRGAVLEEMPRRKLDVHDPYYPLLVGVRAVRA